jgi:hypothetical protein
MLQSRVPVTMRYLLFAVLALAACTRANPDAVGGTGGNGGSGGSGGSAGSGGGGSGGGGSAGGGGTGGGADLSMTGPHDMTVVSVDMTSFAGTFCGTMICTAPNNECCATQSSLDCQSPNVQCNGAPFDCDGPEDCDTGSACCGGTSGSTCNPPNSGGCQGGRVPLCHALSDCPTSNGGGFVACCPSPQGGHIRFCSKNPC